LFGDINLSGGVTGSMRAARMISRPAKDALFSIGSRTGWAGLMDCNPKLQIHGNSMTGMVEGL